MKPDSTDSATSTAPVTTVPISAPGHGCWSPTAPDLKR